jgi:hypothetical protein
VEGGHKATIPIGADNSLDEVWVQKQLWVPVTLQPGKIFSFNLLQFFTYFDGQIGQILIFGTSLAHRSGPNTSSEDRRAVYATYYRKSEGDCHGTYYENRAKRYPPTDKRLEGVDYNDGAKSFAYGTAMLSVKLNFCHCSPEGWVTGFLA